MKKRLKNLWQHIGSAITGMIIGAFGGGLAAACGIFVGGTIMAMSGSLVASIVTGVLACGVGLGVVFKGNDIEHPDVTRYETAFRGDPSIKKSTLFGGMFAAAAATVSLAGLFAISAAQKSAEIKAKAPAIAPLQPK